MSTGRRKRRNRREAGCAATIPFRFCGGHYADSREKSQPARGYVAHRIEMKTGYRLSVVETGVAPGRAWRPSW
jgi:hypothetical protein